MQHPYQHNHIPTHSSMIRTSIVKKSEIVVYRAILLYFHFVHINSIYHTILKTIGNSNSQTLGIQAPRPWEFKFPAIGNSNSESLGIWLPHGNRHINRNSQALGIQTPRHREFKLPVMGNPNSQSLGIRTSKLTPPGTPTIQINSIGQDIHIHSHTS